MKQHSRTFPKIGRVTLDAVSKSKKSLLVSHTQGPGLYMFHIIVDLVNQCIPVGDISAALLKVVRLDNILE